MAIYTLQLLGTLQITWAEGKPARFRSPRAQALLGYLVVERRPVNRDYLATLFWPDESLTTGRGSLRRVLHNLNQILPGCWQINRKTVEFTPAEGTHIDLEAFHRLENQEQWPATADLVRGEFLEGLYLEGNLEFETWLMGERERWRQRVERVLLSATLTEEKNGNDYMARRHLGHLLRLFPWHEEGHRRMMRLLAYSGQFSAALGQYDKCRKFLEDEFGAPPAETTTILYESIKLARDQPTHNLPPSTTPFIGREEEVEILQRHLADPECRLLTLIGVGGIGKSRLALAVARSVATNDYRLFLHGVAMVPLVGVDQPDLLGAIGNSLGLAFSGQQLAERQLLTYLRDMEVLLLLDNYEHLLPETTLLATILQEASAVKFLVTSRERLHLQEEWLFEVEGLPYPEEKIDDRAVGDESSYAAVRLFTTCARRIRRPISLAAYGHEVAEICRLVQGLPLGLELAAAHLESLTPAEVLAELEIGLDILTAETWNATVRHASLRAAFDVSWVRLSTREQQTLSQLSLFRGGFTRNAAAEVAGSTLPILTRLSNKSLIRLLPSGRYEMHELLRQYAAEKLAADKALGAAGRNQYLMYYGEFLKQREQRLLDSDQEAAFHEIGPEMENIRHAWRWATEQDQTGHLEQALWTIVFYYELRGLYLEALEMIEGALSKLAPPDRAAGQHTNLIIHLHLFKSYLLLRTGTHRKTINILNSIEPQIHALGDARALGWCKFVSGNARVELDDLHGGIIDLDAGTAICRQTGVRWLEAVMLARTAFCLARSGFEDQEIQGKVRQLEYEALSISQELNNPWVHNIVNISCSQLAMFRGDYHTSEQLNLAALAAARRVDNIWGIGVALFYLGLGKYLQEDAHRSWQYYEEGQQILRRSGDRHLEATLAAAMGEVARFQREYDEAARLYRWCLEICDRSGFAYLAAAVYCMYGHALWHQGQWLDARAYFLKSLSMPGSRTGPTGDMTALNLAGLAAIFVSKQKPKIAGRLMGAAAAQLEATSRQLWPADRQDWEWIQANIKEALDEKTIETVWAEGRAMSLKQAIACARSYYQGVSPES